MRDLEEIASRHHGVERVYAMRAGREIRVVVDPGIVDDDTATVISQEIAAAIEKETEQPGRIKITVIRESRAVSYAG
jgi:ribonuclease Y